MDKTALPKDGILCMVPSVDVWFNFFQLESMKSFTSVSAKNALLSVLQQHAAGDDQHLPRKTWTD